MPSRRSHSKAEANPRMRVWALGLKIRILKHQSQECRAEMSLEEEMLALNDPQTRQVSGTWAGTTSPGLRRAGHDMAEWKASIRITCDLS